MRYIDDDERRARMAVRHRLLPRERTDDLGRIADDLVALHSTDPVTVYLSALTRMATPSVEAVAAALYEQRTLIRHHAMRRTLWVATPEVARLMHAAATRALVAPERRRTCTLLAAAGVEQPEAWLDQALDQTLAAFAEYGPMTARELGERVPELRQPLSISPGKSYAATQSAHTRVVLLLAFAGRLLRARPTGTWVNGAYRYVETEDWLPGGLGELELRPAAAALADRWLRRFGPATTTDLRWWMGWTAAVTKQALLDIEAEAVATPAGPAWAARDDEPGGPVAPWVAVLPGLDPTIMGWKERAWYLPASASDAFDSVGNAGATLWVDGRVVGAWAQSRDGDFAVHYFEQVAPGRRRELADRLADLRSWVGATRFTLRIPSPADRLLTR